MQPTDIRLSIALITRNRPGWLRRCLESWRAQSVQPFEIVVSDDSDPEFAAEVEKIARELNCSYVKGPRRGMYANRNRAALACRGTHIMSADDDHTHPEGFIQAVIETIAQDQNRVWVFTEKHPSAPDLPLVCPAELAPHGGGRPPLNPSNCKAIADGSTVFPRSIFDIGLRYDESYPRGSIWYLWGVVIAEAGFRISYSDATFIWHHAADSDSEYNRTPEFMRGYLECTTFVSFVNALTFDRHLLPLAWVYGIKRVLVPHSMGGATAHTRLEMKKLFRSWKLAQRASKSLSERFRACGGPSLTQSL